MLQAAAMGLGSREPRNEVAQSVAVLLGTMAAMGLGSREPRNDRCRGRDQCRRGGRNGARLSRAEELGYVDANVGLQSEPQWGSALASRGTLTGNGMAGADALPQWGSALASRGTTFSITQGKPVAMPQWGSALASRGTRHESCDRPTVKGAAMGLGSREPRNEEGQARHQDFSVMPQWGSALASRGTASYGRDLREVASPQWGSALASRGTV